MDRSASPSGFDAAFVRRLKSLARTGPLHDLETNKVQRDGDWSIYDLRALALAAIDVVIQHMGLEYGARPVDVSMELARLAAIAAPKSSPEEHRRVADAVLEGMLNERDRRQAFAAPYADYSADGDRRVLHFHLLREIEAPDGSIVLRATPEAINLFVGALDLDVEDAQTAAEAVLRSQLARGRIDQAAATAREARIRSIQYAEKIRSVLDATRRDIRRVDWTAEASVLLGEALGHLSERLRVERELVTATERVLDAAEPAQAPVAVELVDVLKDCRRRHEELHERVIGARTVFLAEQQRQVFAPSLVLPLPDPEGELLAPVLALPRRDATCVVEVFQRTAVGPKPPHLLRLATLLSGLLQPRREVVDGAGDLIEADLTPSGVETWRFAPQVRDHARTILGSIEEPLRLGDLVGRARTLADLDVAELVSLVALHAFAPQPPDEENSAGWIESLELIATDDGARLDDPDFGGSDLVVGPARSAATREEEMALHA